MKSTKNNDFFLQKIDIENFKAIKNLTVHFKPGLNVIVGENGYGKTAILDAIASGIGGSPFTEYSKKLTEHNKIDIKLRRIQSNDVNFDLENYNFPITLNMDFNRGNQTTNVFRSKLNNRSYDSEGNISYLFGDRLSASAALEDKSVELPVFAYYGTGRIYQKKYSRYSEDREFKIRYGNRLSAYERCLEAGSNEQFLRDWLSLSRLKYLNRRNTREHFFELINVIEYCLPDEVKIIFDGKKEDGLLFHFRSSNRPLPFEFLSDGQKAMVAMIADIGVRCLILNSGVFEKKSMEKTSGIILIDEIDLHIHPKWQKEILIKLKNVFPKLQFIVTTHSPFIIQSLDNGELVQFRDQKLSNSYANESIEDIAENIQNVINPQWSHKRQLMFNVAKDIFRKMAQNQNATDLEKKLLRKEFLSAIKPFADNLAYCAFIELKLFENGFHYEIS